MSKEGSKSEKELRAEKAKELGIIEQAGLNHSFISINVQADVDKPAERKLYALLGTLGAGEDAKVRLAVDKEGNHVAVRVVPKVVKREKSTSSSSDTSAQNSPALRKLQNISSATNSPKIGRVSRTSSSFALSSPSSKRKDTQTLETEDVIVKTYEVMEYIKGKSLADILYGKRDDSGKIIEPPTHLTGDQRRAIAKGFLEEVKRIQDEDVVHCDLHSANVMVNMNDDPPTVRIIDFGLAHELKGKEQVSNQKPKINWGVAPPELWETNEKNKKINTENQGKKEEERQKMDPILYSKKTDTYQAGLVLKELGVNLESCKDLTNRDPAKRTAINDELLESVDQENKKISQENKAVAESEYFMYSRDEEVPQYVGKFEEPDVDLNEILYGKKDVYLRNVRDAIVTTSKQKREIAAGILNELERMNQAGIPCGKSFRNINVNLGKDPVTVTINDFNGKIEDKDNVIKNNSMFAEYALNSLVNRRENSELYKKIQEWGRAPVETLELQNEETLEPQNEGGTNKETLEPQNEGGTYKETLELQNEGGTYKETLEPQNEGGTYKETLEPQNEGGTYKETLEPQNEGGTYKETLNSDRDESIEEESDEELEEPKAKIEVLKGPDEPKEKIEAPKLEEFVPKRTNINYIAPEEWVIAEKAQAEQSQDTKIYRARAPSTPQSTTSDPSSPENLILSKLKGVQSKLNEVKKDPGVPEKITVEKREPDKRHSGVLFQYDSVEQPPPGIVVTPPSSRQEDVKKDKQGPGK